MNTTKQLTWNETRSNRIFAAVLAASVNLLAVVPIFEAFSLRSSALLVMGLFYLLIGYGVPWYLTIRWLEAEGASKTDSEEYVQTRITDNSTVAGVPPVDGRAAA